MNDFLGTEEYEDDDVLVFYGGTGGYIKSPHVTEAKYPDDNPHLAELIFYLAFRNLVVMEDHTQLAFSHGKLISYDYALSFYLTEELFNDLMRGNRKALPQAVRLFANHLSIEKGYKDAIEILHRPNTDFLIDAYLNPIFAFQEADFNPLFDKLGEAFSSTVVDFYATCFALIKKAIEKLSKEDKEEGEHECPTM